MAKSAGSGEGASSIAKDLIDSKDPEHTLFCCEAAFVAIYSLFQEHYSHPLMIAQFFCQIYRTEKLSIKQKWIEQKKLSIEPKRKAIDGTEKL